MQQMCKPKFYIGPIATLWRPKMPQATAIAVPTIRKALRQTQVIEKIGVSKTHLYRLIQKGDFPKSHKLSERVSVWNECEIDEWLAEKFAK